MFCEQNINTNLNSPAVLLVAWNSACITHLCWKLYVFPRAAWCEILKFSYSPLHGRHCIKRSFYMDINTMNQHVHSNRPIINGLWICWNSRRRKVLGRLEKNKQTSSDTTLLYGAIMKCYVYFGCIVFESRNSMRPTSHRGRAMPNFFFILSQLRTE